MAMTLKPQKAQKSKIKFSQNVIIVALVLGIIATILITNYISSAALNDIVYVAQLKESVPKDGIISSEDQFEKVPMLATEYKKQGVIANIDGTERRAIILYDDLHYIFDNGGAYAAVYIRAGRPVYWEDLSETGTQKNSYLYQMDGELVRLDVAPTDFGDMVVPGDKLNIRITYETEDYTLPTDTDYEKIKNTEDIDTSITVTEMLFSEVSILDMLNGSGESIFDLYYELLTLPEAERATIINSEDFKARVAPSNILLSVTAEEADRYAQIKNKGGDYMVTLLPRDGTSEILDALDELKTGFARTE